MRLTSADVTKSSSSIRTAGTSRCGVHLLCLRTDKPVLDIFGIAGKKEKKNLFCKEIENHWMNIAALLTKQREIAKWHTPTLARRHTHTHMDNFAHANFARVNGKACEWARALDKHMELCVRLYWWVCRGIWSRNCHTYINKGKKECRKFWIMHKYM